MTATTSTVTTPATSTATVTAPAAPGTLHPELAKALALLATQHTVQETAQLLDWPAGAIRALIAHQKGWLINEQGHVHDPSRPGHRVRLPAGFPTAALAWAKHVRQGQPHPEAPRPIAAPIVAAPVDAATADLRGLRVACLPVDRIHPDPGNVRENVGDVAELSASIREHGVLQPVTVQPLPGQPGHYQLVMGERRHTGALQAGERELVAIISPELSRAVTLERMLVENCQRAELSPIDKAEAFGELRDVHHYSVTLIAQRVGLSPSTVSYFLSLLDLDVTTRERVRSGELPVGEAVALVRRFRAGERQKEGRQDSKTASQNVGRKSNRRPGQASWEPDHFTTRHPLAKQAQQRCREQEHSSRRQVGQVACGQCWEQTIRADERHADTAARDTRPCPDGSIGREATA
ncbi:ParB/RepB/Spo0J family partition protein [Nonomuraea typhae]|uniref:ParB/RepB/Spo0J family partition protein n=1 Tax=Nonomuraea typhae TaxID=2603600 RepID=UPI0012FA2F52|nr:ParB/RepB/Spo0J family partition protein [Nonomuraea typhae]